MPVFRDKDHYEQLLDRYMAGTASGEEVAELFAYIKETPEQDLFRQKILLVYEQATLSEEAAHVRWDEMFAKITGQQAPQRRSRLRALYWPAAAALVALLAGVYFLLQQRSAPPPLTDVLPAKAGTMLTLADGSMVMLDSVDNGLITAQGAAHVSFKDSGLVYDASGIPATGSTAYNTINTPRGRQFHLMLADGTEVWLNSASSVRYPVTFAGNSRTVEITGEAYFKVKHDAYKPFYVKVNGVVIEDLGTEFNVNGYTDEGNIKTTLLEGAVKIEHTVLKPGQQATVAQGKPGVQVSDVDTELSVAWKNGYFSFREATLEEVMRQLARWYDVEIEYQGGVANRRFGGKISRASTIEQAIQILKESDIHVEMKGKTITVLP